jgi:hypothetical protein
MSRERIAEVARKILCGDIGLVEGSREICKARSGLPDSQLQADVLLPFIAFESELHNFPIGESRRYWNEKALAEKDVQLEEIIAKADPELRIACMALLKAWR